MIEIILVKNSNLLLLPERIYGTIKRVGMLNNEPILYGDVNLLKPNDLYYISGAKLVYRYVKMILGTDNEYLFTTIEPTSESIDKGFSISEERLGLVSRVGYLFNKVIYTGDVNMVNKHDLYFDTAFPYISIVGYNESLDYITLTTDYIDDDTEVTSIISDYLNGKADKLTYNWQVSTDESIRFSYKGESVTIPITIKNTGDYAINDIYVNIRTLEGQVESINIGDLDKDEQYTTQYAYTVTEADFNNDLTPINIDIYGNTEKDGDISLTDILDIQLKADPQLLYLALKALQSGTLTLTIPANITDAYVTSISYSVDYGENWTTVTNDSTLKTITTPTILEGHKVLWKGDALSLSLNTTSGKGTCCNFSSTQNFNVSGNIMSLLKDSNFTEDNILSNTKTYHFNSLFCDCTKLVSASNLILPAETALDGTYRWMFARCTSLTGCAILLADTFNYKSCHSMYYGCTSLVNAPEILPAMTLGNYCYAEMFENCSILKTAPKLPATTLKSLCYQSMFRNCYQLTTAPELPATTLVSNCYYQMFYNCSKLNYIKAMFTTTPSTSYTQNWVYGVSANGTFVKNSAATWTTIGFDAIPTGWTVETASS